jgi:hypothetical protein
MRIRIDTFSQCVHWAANTCRDPVKNMGMDHRRSDIFVVQEFLDSPDIVTVFRQMRSEGMAECMAGREGAG